MIDLRHGDCLELMKEGKTDDYPIYDLDVNEDNTVNIYLAGF